MKLETKYTNKFNSKFIIWLLLLAILTTASNKTRGQNLAYYVKQTQISADLNSYKAMANNSIFTEIIFKEGGIQIEMPNNKFTFIANNKIDKVEIGNGQYRYEIQIDKEMDVALFFTTNPENSAPAKLTFAMVRIVGLKESDPKIITYFRLVFVDELIIR